MIACSLTCTKKHPASCHRASSRIQAKNEVKVLNSLNHPNIVKYYECYQERNMMHIIMEFCQVPTPLLPACMYTMFLAALSCVKSREHKLHNGTSFMPCTGTPGHVCPLHGIETALWRNVH